MKTKRLMTCNSLPEAHIVKGKLESKGVDCFLTNENFTGLFPVNNNNSSLGIQVIVDEDNYKKACDILSDDIPLNTEIITCPSCGSTAVDIVIGRNTFIKTLSTIISTIVPISFEEIKPKYYCKNCKNEFK